MAYFSHTTLAGGKWLFTMDPTSQYLVHYIL